jgi:acyl carrier protein
MDDDRVFEVLLNSVNEFSGREYTAADIDRSRPVFDYGVDSLNMMQILTELEEELELEIDLSELSESQLESVDSLVEFLGSRRNAASESI